MIVPLMEKRILVRRTSIPGADLELPRFIFGTSGLFNIGSAGDRLRLIEAAHDQGFTHFDTAPYYGFGAAERCLGALASRRPDVTITTKVGLYSPGGEEQPEVLTFVRKAAGRLAPALSRAQASWEVARAKSALEGSLRRLKRDHVELYMLHEPEIDRMNSDEWLRFLEDEVAAGRVRRFGLAGMADALEPFVATGTPLANIVQSYDSLEGRESDMLQRHGRTLQITYGYVSSALSRNRDANVPDVLRAALKRNSGGAIIVSTRKPARLAQYERLSAEQPL